MSCDRHICHSTFLVSDVAVGKTSLSHRYVTDAFLLNSESTVRIAFQSKNITFRDADGNDEVRRSQAEAEDAARRMA